MELKIGDKINTENVGEATVMEFFRAMNSDRIVVELADENGTLYHFPLDDIIVN